MLAEIFMLQLEARSRGVNPPLLPSSSALFVPIEPMPLSAELGAGQAEKSRPDRVAE
jgi:hypothetical protein